MPEDGKQASQTRHVPGPRPVAALREALALQAGFAVRRVPPAVAATGGSELAPPQASSPEAGARPAVRPPIRPPGEASMGAAATAPGRPAAGAELRGTGQSSPTTDDSQTSNHFPKRPPDGEARRRTSDPSPRQIDGAGVAGSMAGRFGRPHFPDEGHSLPEKEDDDCTADHAGGTPSEDASFEELEELPAEPTLAAPMSAVAPNPVMDDPDKPRGPDYAEMRRVMKAGMAESEKARVRWRQAHIKSREGLDAEEKESLLRGEGRVKVPSPETLKIYLARGKGLLARFRHETGTRISLEDLDPRQFVNWLLGLKPFLADGTFRGYRVCAEALIQSIPSENTPEAMAMLRAGRQVGSDGAHLGRAEKDVDYEGQGVRASLRAKRIEYEHYQDLRRSLRVMSRSQVVEWLLDWLDAGINTGLRPSEWALTSLERRPDCRFRHGEHIWLHVVNAKAAVGRGITYRTLDISEFEAETLGAVERMVKRSRDWAMAGRSTQRQGEISHLLRKTCKTRFPHMRLHYTLDCLGDQFIANMKTICPREELAAMVGHISIDTQIDHYAKRRASWTKEQITCRPKPVKEQVFWMKKQLEYFDVRSDIRKAARAAKRAKGAVDR